MEKNKKIRGPWLTAHMKKYLLITAGIIFFASVGVTHAATNISATSSQHWAWNDVIGWMDFYVGGTSNITVSAGTLTGNASSTVGPVSLDCHTSPVGNICSPTNGNYQVLNDGGGNLSGWAWNDTIGWISFWCGNTGGCGTSAYRVSIDASGNFSNYAWNDAVGWISFNCNDPGICGTSNYLVNAAWSPTSTTGTLDSTTFDTGIAAGAQLNSVMWQGNLPGGTTVAFQVAVANASSGPWNFTGPDGTSGTTWAGGNPGIAVPFSNYPLYTNYRYFRYRVLLTSNTNQSATPRVDDVIISWSP
jgi:hypothetical protein